MNYLDHIRSDSHRFGEVLSSVDPDGRVPACPDWTAVDLAWHLTEVQWFWGSIVGDRLDSPDAIEKPDRPEGLGATLDLFGTASDRLVEALAGADPSDFAWSWHELDQTVGFTLRRQAHEALIHRIDAEAVAGVESSVDVDLGADGIDEILRVMIGGVPEWGHFEPDGASLRIHAPDAGRRWGLAFGRFTGTSPESGTEYDLDAATVGVDATKASAAIDGPAADLDMWLWGRRGSESLGLFGQTELVDRLRHLAAESTQ